MIGDTRSHSAASGSMNAWGLALLTIMPCIVGNAHAAVLSSKRGFADVSANYNNLQATGAGWYYTWGTGVANPGNFGANHVPMIWGGTPSQNTINTIRNRPGVEWLLGFNEPERPDQANMTVAQAITSWTTISNGFAGSGIKLVSPAVADTGGATGGQQWLASFMSQAAANSLQVDAVAFHWYGVSTPNNPAGAASSFLSRVDSYHNSYGKPVFITEFAIHDWGGIYTNEQISDTNRQFLEIVIPGLESREYVAGYAWYHWFDDAPLYTDTDPSPMSATLTPTAMGRRYVGALMPGQVENFTNQNYGEHAVYLAGGEFTTTGPNSGVVHYINALSGISAISGATDWGLTGTNWVQVQPDATLRKTGANRITWSGRVSNNGTVEVSQGELQLDPGAVFFGTGNLRTRGVGTLILNGGRIDRTPLELRGGTIRTDVSLPHTVGGAVYNTTTFSGSADFLLSAALTEGAGGTGAGLIKQGSGTLTLGADNTYSGTTEVMQGTLVVSGKTGFGSTTVANSAALEGGGMVRSDLVAQSGSTIRSHSLIVETNFIQQDGAMLELLLTSDSVFDRLIVGGNLDALGILKATLSSGFDPVLGQSFDLLDFATFSNGFSDFDLPQLGAGLAWDMSDLGITGELQVIAVGLSGDYNNDEIVDAADYTVWRDSFGQMGDDLPADGDNDDEVTVLDYDIWKAHYGSMMSEGGAGGNAAASSAEHQCAVPEPTAIQIYLMTLLLMWVYGRSISPASCSVRHRAAACIATQG